MARLRWRAEFLMLANIIRNAKKTVGGGGGGIVTGGDPYYSAVSLLLPMDGTNGSTTFTDSGPNALAVTATSATISTTQSKYGGASGYFNGTSSYLQTGSSSDSRFLFGTGDFTVEFWMYVTAFSGSNIQTTINNYAGVTAGWNIQINCLNTNNVRFAYGDTTIALTASNTLTAGQWYHIAVTRSGTSVTIWINGTASATATNSTNISAGAILTIGRGATYSGQYFNGYIDDLRITKGVARYTSAFAPPSQAHPNIYNPYTTLPVPGAALWLDASQQNTIFTDAGTTPVTTSGQSVYQWNDLSGNNRHAVQATSGNRPTWVPPASGQNGLGVTSFNGSNNFFVGQWQNFTDLTLFIVARNTNAYSPGGRIFSQSDDTYADNVQTPTTTYIPAAVASTSQFLSTNISQQVILSVSFPNNTYQRFIHRRTGTTGSNTVGSTTTAGTIGTVTRNMTRYCMGRTTNGTDGNWAGQICEVIAFPRQLTSGEEASINSYLNTKWGTP